MPDNNAQFPTFDQKYPNGLRKHDPACPGIQETDYGRTAVKDAPAEKLAEKPDEKPDEKQAEKSANAS